MRFSVCLEPFPYCLVDIQCWLRSLIPGVKGSLPEKLLLLCHRRLSTAQEQPVPALGILVTHSTVMQIGSIERLCGLFGRSQQSRPRHSNLLGTLLGTMDPGQGTRAGAACSCVCIFTNVLWDCCCKNSNMSNGQVIRAAQMFVKHGAGASKGVNLKAEMAMGLTLGLGVGLTWKVCLALE